jgi:ankyrin repeat protein
VTDTYGGCCCSLLEEHREHPEELNINCVDPLNRSALITAIENENIELIRILLEWNIDVKVHVVTIRMWDS